MTQHRTVTIVYMAGLMQGIGLVTFPAASTILTSPEHYALSESAYGTMFVPQAVLAIAASLLGTQWQARLGIHRIFLLGLSANLLAMVLLVTSRFVMSEHGPAYGLLLVATSCIGLGFGFLVPVLNTAVAALFTRTPDRAVLVLNALLGLGTALAPVFVAGFAALGWWWGLPLLVAALIAGLLAASINRPLDVLPPTAGAPEEAHEVPRRFWIFAAFALGYGVCETLSGNWVSLYMAQHFHAGTGISSLALTLFWSLVTIGRVVFAAIGQWVAARLVWQVLPLVVAGAFLVCALAPPGHAGLGLLGFALAGLGCSALLPLAISFGQSQLAAVSASVAGGLIAFYQLGYGLAAFGVGPLLSFTGLGLNAIYGWAVVIALLTATLSLVIVRLPAVHASRRT